MSAEPTPGPWHAIEMGGTGRDDPKYIRIVGSGYEKVCDIFPHASVGGQGIEIARANAAWILKTAPDAPVDR